MVQAAQFIGAGLKVPVPVRENPLIGPRTDHLGQDQVVRSRHVRGRGQHAAFHPGDGAFHQRAAGFRSGFEGDAAALQFVGVVLAALATDGAGEVGLGDAGHADAEHA